MSPIRAILFDFDGVIVHTAPIVKRALWYFFREKGFSIVEEDFETDNYVSKSLEQVCECLFQKYALALDINELRSGIWDTQLALMKE
jgi:beta-phosphoglucomutase-like phosphatase (HAD superfamily)